MKCDVCVTSKEVLRASSGGAQPTHDPETRLAARQKLEEHYTVRCQFSISDTHVVGRGRSSSIWFRPVYDDANFYAVCRGLGVAFMCVGEDKGYNGCSFLLSANVLVSHVVFMSASLRVSEQIGWRSRKAPLLPFGPKRTASPLTSCSWLLTRRTRRPTPSRPSTHLPTAVTGSKHTRARL